MAHSLLANTSLVRAILESTKLSISRRSYSASVAAVAAVEEKTGMMSKKETAGPSTTTPSSCWVPDPVTGYYQPANKCQDVHAAELREEFLSNKSA
ncbi:hypothetical protein J5N97_009531 [Dioscorea zingiberensis]|uniref:Late embryogenesis abundant protein n=1 Tax=Dioscorea zingiberensis TaxID=325984 RepID=A0A9D5CX22_9LILI|nr:hypothetical protein J5N97_009531 [Dioscorea zingiberensis]